MNILLCITSINNKRCLKLFGGYSEWTIYVSLRLKSRSRSLVIFYLYSRKILLIPSKMFLKFRFVSQSINTIDCETLTN